MPLLPGQLARQRAKALEDLTGLCAILRYEETQNSLGEPIKAWATIDLDVPCRVANTSSMMGRDERERLSAIAQVTQWYIVVPHDQEITGKDRVEVYEDSGETLNPPRQFMVDRVLGPHTDEIRRRALADEVS